MSTFKNFTSVRLSPNERIMEINGPEIFLILSWFDKVKEQNHILANESGSIINILDRGPIFEHYEPMMLTIKQLSYLEQWYKHAGSPEDEISDKILKAIEAAKAGKKRPDLDIKKDKPT